MFLAADLQEKHTTHCPEKVRKFTQNRKGANVQLTPLVQLWLRWFGKMLNVTQIFNI